MIRHADYFSEGLHFQLVTDPSEVRELLEYHRVYGKSRWNSLLVYTHPNGCERDIWGNEREIPGSNDFWTLLVSPEMQAIKFKRTCAYHVRKRRGGMV